MRISDWSSDVCSSDLARTQDEDCHQHSRGRGRSAGRHPAGEPRRPPVSSGPGAPRAEAAAPPAMWPHTRAMPIVVPPQKKAGPDGLGMALPAPESQGDGRSRTFWDRKSGVEGKRGYGRVAIGGRRLIKKKPHKRKT